MYYCYLKETGGHRNIKYVKYIGAVRVFREMICKSSMQYNYLSVILKRQTQV